MPRGDGGGSRPLPRLSVPSPLLVQSREELPQRGRTRAAMAHEAHTDLGMLAAELERLVHEERQISAVRRRLHEQIDNGFPNDVIVRREREISAHRRALHLRIDSLRHRLGPGPGLRPAH